MKVTLKQIAERAGVSINTVSLALRNMPSVNGNTREHIFQIAEELGYFEQKGRNEVAQNLCLISTGAHLKDSYFYMSFHQLILGLAYERGYNMMVFDNEYFNSDTERLRRHLNTNSIGGILILGDMDEHAASRIVQCGLPVVAIGSRYHDLRVCTFIEDNFQAAYQAVRHLHERGFRRIGFIGDPLYSTAFMERYQSFLSALRIFGLSSDPASHLTAFTPDNYDQNMMLQAIQECPHLPEAFFCANDSLGIAAVKALHDAGLSIPQDISVIGVDNNPMGKMTIPSLTSVDVRCALQAELSVNKLISFVQGASYEPLRFIVPTLLIQGDSVGMISQ
ncbi:LacI family transcriptional regulator [Intestinibacillus massiliensis]|uniref:LacI family DNA-binding transcriptional regulator n=1 Tax=Intestinibacillus massiliensis TaxID=1871029 RepID=UPI000B35A2CC|nr:LacI family DNA-binding transcriptional regulator [Intestinibacillus massiliensis]MCB6365076.1 LacI family transcriptional regulator [Intestinibacillus massiliensis]